MLIMAKIKFTDSALDYLKKREVLGHPMLLIVDDGGGKYSIHGGSCSIGANFSIIKLNKPDKDYPEKLQNDEGVEIFTSNYDLVELQDNLVLDYKDYSLQLKNDSQMLDRAVSIGNGPALLEANHHVVMNEARNC